MSLPPTFVDDWSLEELNKFEGQATCLYDEANKEEYQAQKSFDLLANIPEPVRVFYQKKYDWADNVEDFEETGVEIDNKKGQWTLTYLLNATFTFHSVRTVQC